MNKKTFLSTLLFFMVLAPSINSQPNVNSITENDRKVFLHYLPWYQTPDIGGSWRHWNFCDHDPDQIDQEGQRDISAVHYPLIEPYDSYDEKVIQFHLLLARACNIDGMIIDWYGKDITPADAPAIDSVTGRIFDLADSLRNSGIEFELAIMYEEQVLKDLPKEEQIKKLKADLEYIINIHGSRESYLKYAEKPVIFYFQQKNESNEGIISPGTLDSTLNLLSNPILIYKDPEPAYLSVIDGCYCWVKGEPWKEDGSDWGYKYVNWFYKHVNSLSASYSNLKLSIGGVWAGFDDIRVGINFQCEGRRWIDRKNGEIYKKCWQEIFDYESNPAFNFPVNWVQIITWNDWNEGSEIEPGLEYGYQYIQATKDKVREFKSNSPPDTSINILIPQHLFQAAVATEKNQVPRDSAQKLINESIVEYLNNNFKKSISLADKAAGIPAPKSRITGVGENFIEIEWEAVPGATGYNIYFAPDSNAFKLFPFIKPTTLTISDGINIRLENLQPQTRYFVGVTSFNTSLGKFANEGWYENTIDTVTILDATTTIKNGGFSIPDQFSLSQNYPNPFNSQTKVNYDLAGSCPVELCIFNLIGQEIVILEKAYKMPGRYSVSWEGHQKNGDQSPSGVYLLYFKAGAYVEIKKIMLIR